MDIAKSLAFINERGTNLEKARANTIIGGVPPPPDIVHYLTELQNENGGFPFGTAKHNPGTVSDTLVALWWLDDLGMLDSPLAKKAERFLRSVQKEDGGWDEVEAIAGLDPPPWAIPGDLKARLYLTADSAFWLAVTGYTTDPAFHTALDFLLRHQDETGKCYGFLHATWIAAAVLFIAGGRYIEAAQRGLRVLTDRPLDRWADSQLGWALGCFTKTALPKTHPFIENCLAELLKRQKPDGSWSSEDGAPFDVGATIDALKALKHYGKPATTL